MPTRPLPPRTRRVLLAAVAVLAVFVAALGLDAWLMVHRIPAFAVSTPATGAGTTYLVLASDSRERLSAADRARYADRAQPSGERADLVLVVDVPEGGGATAYSLPRDLYVGRERDRPHRLGLALQDGPQAMVDSLCQDVGVGVDHVLIADMDALVGAVDVVGGVEVTTAAPVRDRRARLDLPRAGTHLLDGDGALAWVRSRSPQVRVGERWVPDRAADPSRTEHAAQVLRGVADRVDDPVTAQRLGWDVGPRLRRDDGLGLRGLVGMARALRSAAAAGRVVTVPARFSGTEVPFAFVTDQTRAALEPLETPGCRER